jgi:hypothetical protein
MHRWRPLRTARVQWHVDQTWTNPPTHSGPVLSAAVRSLVARMWPRRGLSGPLQGDPSLVGKLPEAARQVRSTFESNCP